MRLEPLTLEHVPELAQIAFEPSIWKWTQRRVTTDEELRAFVDIALQEASAGKSIPWVSRSKASGLLAGSTRLMDLVPEHRTLEIGGTWLHPDFHRSGINVEAKYLQLSHAFERMGARRVALKTHHQNLKSQAAIRGIGATQEGIFRNHMVHSDGLPRHSVWFSVIAEEWPAVKSMLEQRMAVAQRSSDI